MSNTFPKWVDRGKKREYVTCIHKGAGQITHKIERGIPMPEAQTRRKYPFNEMEIGDSFKVDRSGIASARIAAYSWGKRHGKTFAVRRDGDAGRIWRVS